MQGTVKWFNAQKGYGFITDSEGKDVFVHHSNIVMGGFRYFNKGDVVRYNVVIGDDGRERAINVKPILTLTMVVNGLAKEEFHIQTMKDGYGVTKYLVVDQNNAIQTDENGMSFLELAAYAGFDTEGLSA